MAGERVRAGLRAPPVTPPMPEAVAQRDAPMAHGAALPAAPRGSTAQAKTVKTRVKVARNSTPKTFGVQG